jgi:hypothetical protein
MALKYGEIWNIKQRMQQSRIAYVNLWCFDLALAEILVPWIEHTDNESGRERIQAPPRTVVCASPSERPISEPFQMPPA